MAIRRGGRYGTPVITYLQCGRPIARSAYDLSVAYCRKT